MILRTTGEDVARQAVNGDYLGMPYSKYDCQAFVEQVLKDLGVRKPDGTPYNWKGSNSMWRNHIRWQGSIENCRKKFGCIPKGAFVFLIKYDGDEQLKGYHDDLGNASHVGLYIGYDTCMDSQPTGGVQYRKLSIFTHVGLMDMIDYSTSPELPPEPDETDETDETEAVKAVHTLRDENSTDEECLKALKFLTKYCKEVNI